MGKASMGVSGRAGEHRPRGSSPANHLVSYYGSNAIHTALSTPPLSTPLTTQLHPLPSLLSTAFTPTPLDFGYCNSFLIKPTQFLSAQFNSTQSSSTHYNLSFI